jgi:transposase
MIKLLKKGQKWNWSEAAQLAFEELKTKLVKAPILSCPDFSRPFCLQTDASYSGLGSVLTQNLEGEEKVIAYASRSLTDAEKKYSVTEKELLAILWSIRKFRPYLEGYNFEVVTDHFALKWLNTLQNPSGRLARWSLELQEYSFTVTHRKGNLHKVPDALSIIPELTALQMETVDFSKITDPWYQHRLRQVQESLGDWPDWNVDNGRLYHLRLNLLGSVVEGTIERWKLVVPLDFRHIVFEENHDVPTAGHLGITKTFLRIARSYHWPGLFRDVVKYVRSCKVCQVQKVEQKVPVGKMSFRRVDGPWVTVTTDLLGPYPRSKKGNQYVVVFQDYFTKWVELKTLRSATAKRVVDAFRNLVVLKWGVPRHLICDNGPQFVSNLFAKVAEAYNMELKFTPPYTPQANPTERVNRVIKTMMSSYMGKVHDDWDSYLAECAHCLNSVIHSGTGYSPAYFNFGRELRLPSALDEKEMQEMQDMPTRPARLASSPGRPAHKHASTLRSSARTAAWPDSSRFLQVRLSYQPAWH